MPTSKLIEPEVHSVVFHSLDSEVVDASAMRIVRTMVQLPKHVFLLALAVRTRSHRLQSSSNLLNPL